MRLAIALTFVAVSSAATSASAETIDAVDLIEKCTIAMQYDGDVASVAVPLSKIIELDLTPDNRTRGMECLKRQFGFQFYFDTATNSFKPDKSDMERTRPAREAAQREKEEQIRQQEALRSERAAKEEEKRKQQDAAYDARRLVRLRNEEIQKREEANKDELNRRIRKACYDSLETTPLLAVTHPTCQDIFIENGFDQPKDAQAEKP
ncbi:hypothetical protein D2T31_12115 [Sinirhodobacter populi]|uniref:Uncharacterized protein n=1 Tax=Paenirhodobacter populi TaxID=2306993 RepID=A0A443K7Z4_9RHOB|nr:hypothetical protein [Sinirhodobacter populi]RWR28850.1 hypothetical protein D2T31_12115 [Sinirhodobacter populi]